MLPIERQQRIKALVLERGNIKISELSKTQVLSFQQKEHAEKFVKGFGGYVHFKPP